MLYAPNVRNEDLGLIDANYDANSWLPSIAYEGLHRFPLRLESNNVAEISVRQSCFAHATL
jgi:hypothetical protein